MIEWMRRPRQLTQALAVLAMLVVIMLTGGISGADEDHADADSTAPDDSLGEIAALDTVPTLSGLTVVDIDSLLLSGVGVMLAFEDTLPIVDGTADTLFVDAPRVKVGEVVPVYEQLCDALSGAHSKGFIHRDLVRIVRLRLIVLANVELRPEQVAVG